MTTSEYFGDEEEGNGENKGGLLDALKQGGIKGLAMSIGESFASVGLLAAVSLVILGIIFLAKKIKNIK